MQQNTRKFETLKGDKHNSVCCVWHRVYKAVRLWANYFDNSKLLSRYFARGHLAPSHEPTRHVVCGNMTADEIAQIHSQACKMILANAAKWDVRFWQQRIRVFGPVTSVGGSRWFETSWCLFIYSEALLLNMETLNPPKRPLTLTQRYRVTS
jgi:hypothetical protein